MGRKNQLFLYIQGVELDFLIIKIDNGDVKKWLIDICRDIPVSVEWIYKRPISKEYYNYIIDFCNRIINDSNSMGYAKHMMKRILEKNSDIDIKN